jgi:hypothetical protein
MAHLDQESHFCTQVCLFGREMAKIQPPTHTLAPTRFFCAEVFHISFLSILNHSKGGNGEVFFGDKVWQGMVGLTNG